MVIPKSTVLYIDDDFVNLAVFEESFKEKFNVITLSSTRNAAEVLKNNQVKVIVADQNMPDETGLEFIKRIKTDYPEIIYIIFTAYSSKEIAIQAINDAGIFKFLLKPWNYIEIETALENAIREFDYQYVKNELHKRNEAIIEAYKKVEENEKKFYTIFAKSNDAIYILNYQNEIIEANKALTDLIGFNEYPCDLNLLNTFIKCKFPVLLDKPFEITKKEANYISEIEIILNHSERKVIEISCNEITYNKTNYILSIIRDITDRRTFERKIVETIIQTQEDEQSKYARELHDGLGPLLSTLKMHIEWMANPNNSVNKDQIIQHSILVIDNAIKSVKEIANNLSPHILMRFGLVNALESYIVHVKESTNIEFMVSSNLKERLKGNVELVLYRVILECLNNAVKHSMAKKINLTFNKQNNFYLLGIPIMVKVLMLPKNFLKGVAWDCLICRAE
jgi:PAS domain S-box-containing protein